MKLLGWCWSLRRLAPKSAVMLAGGLAAFFILSSGWGQSTGTCSLPTLECSNVSELLTQREGYGRSATGGLGGRFVVVTSNADSGPGTLRDFVEKTRGPIWVTFASDMAIDLRAQIRVPSNVTIDGRGRSVTLNDWGLTLFNAYNVIVTHIAVDGRFREDTQAVNVVTSHDIWLNHLTLARTLDRLVNVKTGSTDVTLSWIRFEDHNRVMLFNNLPSENLFEFYDRDSRLRVTLHHSYFLDTVQRHPRAQIGTSHIYNNLLENWDFYGMSFSLEHRSLIEGNIFSNTMNRPCTLPKEIGEIYCKGISGAPALTAMANGEIDREEYERSRTKYHYTRDWRAFLKVSDNLYLGDTKPVLADYQPDKVPAPPYCYSYEQPDVALSVRIKTGAGNRGNVMPAIKRTCPIGVRATLTESER